MSRKAWIVFIIVQLFGELGPWAGLRMKSSLGPALWVTGMVAMMPGRLLALFVAEKLLWNVGFTPPRQRHSSFSSRSPLTCLSGCCVLV